MLSGYERRRLSEIESSLWLEDERFTEALNRGCPRSPRQYRLWPVWVVLIVLPTSLLIAAMTIALLGVLSGAAAFVALWLYHRWSIDRPPGNRIGPRHS